MLGKELKIGIASDHAGYELKQKIIDHIKELNLPVIDYGTNSVESVDYPDFAKKLAIGIELNDINYGVLICGSGIGMSMSANRSRFVRAALCHNIETAKLSREHNNANVLVLGARFTSFEDSKNIMNAFLTTEFQGGRHFQRINKY
jgi:ribose 5-phosphate isomerase B